MNREILIDALEGLDTGLIERYFEIKEKLRKRRAVTKSAMRWTVSAACIALIACTVIPLAMRISQPPDPPVVETTPGSEETTPPEDVTTEAPIKVDPPVFDPKNVIHQGHYDALSANADLNYVDWNGIEISESLDYLLMLYNQINIADKKHMFAINVFRRDERSFYENYLYEGKSYRQLCEQTTHPARQINVLRNLLEYGEILKYGKDVIITTGVPQDEPIVEIRGRRMMEKDYDRIVDLINYYDPLTLSRYIIDGVFLKDKAQEDYDTYCSVLNDFEDKVAEMRNAYFCRYKEKDVSTFEELGFITGEVNGKLYIIVSYDQLLSVSNSWKMIPFTFVPLPEDDFYEAYPISDISDDYEIERTTTGFEYSKISFDGMRGEYKKNVSNDDEFYANLNMAIQQFKNKSTCIEFKIISKSFEYGCIDISELKDMNIKEHLYWRAGYTTIISVELDKINLEALKMLTLREDIKKIIISNPIYTVYE
ncbi:MAG: hypothetical protein II319_07745 [Clostridia bacterium]|nr:hypothetical protein [Clostridia bacterium]